MVRDNNVPRVVMRKASAIYARFCFLLLLFAFGRLGDKVEGAPRRQHANFDRLYEPLHCTDFTLCILDTDLPI